MPYDTYYVRAMKHEIISDIFVRTADENYIAARWCALNGLHLDFLWLAVHALEKYMKAALLINEHSVKDHSHNISHLYNIIYNNVPNLLPDYLNMPVHAIAEIWQPTKMRDFIDHLHSGGNSHNRYLLYGFLKHFWDLQLLDQTVFSVRRLFCLWDDPLVPQEIQNAPNTTNKEYLARHPSFRFKLNMPLDVAVEEKHESALRHAALDHNFPFAPAGYVHSNLIFSSASRNPVLVRHVLEPLESDDFDTAQLGMTLAQWVLANITLPGNKKNPDIVQQIQNSIDLARKRHPNLTE